MITWFVSPVYPCRTDRQLNMCPFSHLTRLFVSVRPSSPRNINLSSQRESSHPNGDEFGRPYEPRRRCVANLSRATFRITGVVVVRKRWYITSAKVAVLPLAVTEVKPSKNEARESRWLKYVISGLPSVVTRSIGGKGMYDRPRPARPVVAVYQLIKPDACRGAETDVASPGPVPVVFNTSTISVPARLICPCTPRNVTLGACTGRILLATEADTKPHMSWSVAGGAPTVVILQNQVTAAPCSASLHQAVVRSTSFGARAVDMCGLLSWAAVGCLLNHHHN